MLGLDRRAAQAAWTVFLIALLLATIYAVRRTLVIFALALFFAYLLWPVVGFVRRFMPRRMSENTALAVVYVLLVAILVTLGTAVGSQIAEQATNLASRLPDYVDQSATMATMPLPPWLEPVRAKALDTLRSQAANLGKEVVPLLRKAGEGILSGLGSLLSIVLIPVLSFFFLKDGAQIRETVVGWISQGQRQPLLDDIITDVHLLLGQYIRALVILSAATFVAYSLFLGIIGMPYAVLLAGVAAILEFIPVVGPLSASIVILLVGAFTGFGHLLWLLGFVVVYRIFQDYVLNPYVMGTGVEVHPLLLLFGVLAGEQIAGIPGMFFSVPVIAMLRVVLVRLRRTPRVL